MQAVLHLPSLLPGGEFDLHAALALKTASNVQPKATLALATKMQNQLQKEGLDSQLDNQ